jgi:peroxiredoxin
MREALIAIAVAAAMVAPAGAGKYNGVLSIGDDAPAWVDLPGVDGKKHSLADLKDKRVVVVVFTCNSCPAASDYEERLIAFVKKSAVNASSVAVVALNVSRLAEDRLPQMQERAKEKGFNFAYLYDESQKIGKVYGAAYTPEFFVLDKDRKVVYMGAMDDKSPPAQPATRFLEQAVEGALKGEKVAAPETLARGCRIRYARAR